MIDDFNLNYKFKLQINLRYELKNKIEDVIKLSGFSEIIDLKKIENEKFLCTLKIISQIEYTSDNEKSLVLINEFSSLVSEIVDIKYCENISVSIIKMKAKFYNGNIISIYYKVAFH